MGGSYFSELIISTMYKLAVSQIRSWLLSAPLEKKVCQIAVHILVFNRIGQEISALLDAGGVITDQ